jgi:hypothetical protein
MAMLLSHLWHAGGVREFDPSTGAVGSVVDVSRDKAQWGFLWQQRGRWFAIRKDDESLIFQAGPSWWRLSNDVELRVTRGFIRRFQLARGGRTAFSLRYVFRGAAQAAVDPTYDAIDEESDDFYLYVTEMWRHWKDRSMETFLAP